jgi:hypothetical protein
VLVLIAKVNLDRSHELAPRLAVARLSSVCKAWDAALLPLFHPGVPGVISPAELRALKRLALDQTDRPPSSAQVGAGHSHSQQEGRSGFLLPQRMLAATDFKPKHRTALTEGFWSRVQDYFNVSMRGGLSKGGLMFTHLVFYHFNGFGDFADISLDRLLRSDLYGRARQESPSPIEVVLLSFTNTVCLAYRILMVVKAVEARAIALGEAAVSGAAPADALSKDGGALHRIGRSFI